MKTEENAAANELEGKAEEHPRADEVATNGVSGSKGGSTGPGSGVEAVGAAPPSRARTLGDLPPVQSSRLLKSVYWALWFVLLPIVLGCLLVWALTPPSGVEPAGGFGWIQSLARGQPVPVAIVLFTLIEVALWAARHQLPLAKFAHPPLRPDLPVSLRGAFERARILIDEAEMIMAKHEKAIVRDLTAKERETVRRELSTLRQEMERVPFDDDRFLAALTRADGEVDARLGRWRKGEVREYVEAIVMAVLVALGLRAFVIEAFKIPSGSMIPTLMVGDHIFVNKFSYGPAIPYTHARVWTSMPPSRGDVIVFAFPEHPEQDFIKRVIAIEGDKLEARNGHPIINGWEVPSCRVGPWVYSDSEMPITRHEGDLYVEYLGEQSFLTFYDRASGAYPENQGPFYAKKGEVWVMGDNRNNSHDSRMWFGGQGGGVPYDNIRGRALFVWLSVSDSTFDWSREGAPVMGRPRLPPTAAGLTAQFETCLKNRPSVTRPPTR